jgi:hypothetical protein
MFYSKILGILSKVHEFQNSRALTTTVVDFCAGGVKNSPVLPLKCVIVLMV